MASRFDMYGVCKCTHISDGSCKQCSACDCCDFFSPQHEVCLSGVPYGYHVGVSPYGGIELRSNLAFRNRYM